MTEVMEQLRALDHDSVQRVRYWMEVELVSTKHVAKESMHERDAEMEPNDVGVMAV